MFALNNLAGFGGKARRDYVVQAVNFDGTNDYLTRGGVLTGSTDISIGTLSVWLKLNAAMNGVLGTIFNNTGQTARLLHTTADEMELRLREDGGANRVTICSNTGWTSTDDWFNLLMSWDKDGVAADQQCYINDVDDKASETHGGPAEVDWTEDIAIGAAIAGGNKYFGDMAELWVSFVQLDLSVTANRRKFIDVNGKPVDIGSSGQNPTGDSPIMCFFGPTIDWHTNKGTGGGFTEFGALTDAASSPSD